MFHPSKSLLITLSTCQRMIRQCSCQLITLTTELLVEITTHLTSMVHLVITTSIIRKTTMMITMGLLLCKTTATWLVSIKMNSTLYIIINNRHISNSNLRMTIKISITMGVKALHKHWKSYTLMLQKSNNNTTTIIWQ